MASMVAAADRPCGRPQGRPSTLSCSSSSCGLIVSPAALIFLVQTASWVWHCAWRGAGDALARLSRTARLRRDQLDRDLLTSSMCSPSQSVRSGVPSGVVTVSERFGGLWLRSSPGAAPDRQRRDSAGASSSSETATTQSRSASLSRHTYSPTSSVPHGSDAQPDRGRYAQGVGQRRRRKAAQVAPRVTLVNSLVLVPGH